MESITKVKLFGIPLLAAAAIGIVIYWLLKAGPAPTVQPLKAVTSGSGVFQYQQAANTGLQPAPSPDASAVASVAQVAPADAYWLYNVPLTVNGAIPSANAPTANPLTSSSITTEPGNPNAFPWQPASANPDNGTPQYAPSQTDQINGLVSSYGDIFSKSLVAMAQAGYGPLGNN